MQSQTHWIRKPTRQIIRAGHGLTLVGRPGVGLAGPASPARPINFLYDGPRPGQAHQISIWWAAARPGSSSFGGCAAARPGPAHQLFGGWPPAGPAHNYWKTFTARFGPARSIFLSSVSAWPGPTHHMAARPMKHGIYMGRPDKLRGPALGFYGPAHVLSRSKMCMCIC